MKNKREIQFRRYRIVAAELESGVLARAFLRGGRQGTGAVLETKGDTVEAAIEVARAKLHARDEDMRQKRRFDEYWQFHVPTKQEFIDALHVVSLSPPQLAMLDAHALAGSTGMTAGEIALAGGYDHFETANALYGKVGRAIADALGVTPPDAGNREGDVATGVIATAGPPREETEHFVWIMYPELASALTDPRAQSSNGTK